MSTSGLSTAGGAVYDGSTMTVGDGTWDSTTNTFLLPNIQGLNLATTIYNGMGHRFSTLTEYHGLIKAHGVIAAITFLGIVPLAILTARFYYRDPRFALKTHISLQILTLILSTVVLVLGYFAVGPSRSLSNPHHGIGVAIYVMVIIQTLGGAIIHRIEKGKVRYYLPIKLMLHQWLGRAIALLALAQIPIGLALYGSPKYLFILYAVAMAALVATYFLLTYENQRRIGLASWDNNSSYLSGSRTDMSRRPEDRSRLGALTGAFAGGVGLDALRRRISNRGRGGDGSRGGDERSHVSYSQGPYPSQMGTESYMSEKYSNDGRNHTWRDRILGATAGVGAFSAVRNFMNRSNKRDDDRYDSRYDQRTQGNRSDGGQPQDSTARLDQMEEGRPLVPPGGQGNIPMGAMRSEGAQQNTQEEDWQRVERMEREQAAAGAGGAGLGAGAGTQYPQTNSQRPQSQYGFGPQARRPGDSMLSYDSRDRGSESNYSRPGLLAKFATVGGIGDYLKRRRSKKEKKRLDADRQRESQYGRVSDRPQEWPPQQQPLQDRPLVIGDDIPLPNTGIPTSHVSFKDPITDNGPPTVTHDFAMDGTAPPPGQIPGFPSNYSSNPNLQQMNRENRPPPPPTHRNSPDHNNTTQQTNPYAQPPTQPYANQQDTRQSPYASRTNLPQTSSSLRNPPQAQSQPQYPTQNYNQPIVPPMPAAVATNRGTPPRPLDQNIGYSAPLPNHPQPSNNVPPPPAPVASPPIAISVRLKDDHVTLRRLNQEEAALERDRRYQRGQQQGQQPQQPPQPPQLPGWRTGGNGAGQSVSDLSNTAGYRRQGQQSQPGQGYAGTVSPVPAVGIAQKPSRPTVLAVPQEPQQTGGAPYPRQSLYAQQQPPQQPSQTQQPHVPTQAPYPSTPITHTAQPSNQNQMQPPRPTGRSPINIGSSPGAYDTATGTDVSHYDDNRRRRRAERARAEQARLAARMGTGFGSGSEIGLSGGGGGQGGGAEGGGGRRVGFA